MKTKRMICLAALACFLPASTDGLKANEAQLWIFNTGLYLGWAKAQMQFYGEAAEDRVRENLNLARDSMQRAEQLFAGPLLRHRQEGQYMQRVIAAIDGYADNTRNSSTAAKVGYLGNLFSLYRSGFEYTYDSSRLDSVHRQPNCDLYILLTGFTYGQAWVASLRPSNRARHYQSGWAGEMRAHIQSGISLSMDPENRLVQTDAVKVCCCFGAKTEWERLPLPGPDTPVETFQNLLEAIRTVVRNAGVPACDCGGDTGAIVSVPPPPPPVPPPPPAPPRQPPPAPPDPPAGTVTGGRNIFTPPAPPTRQNRPALTEAECWERVHERLAKETPGLNLVDPQPQVKYGEYVNRTYLYDSASREISIDLPGWWSFTPPGPDPYQRFSQGVYPFKVNAAGIGLHTINFTYSGSFQAHLAGLEENKRNQYERKEHTIKPMVLAGTRAGWQECTTPYQVLVRDAGYACFPGKIIVTSAVGPVARICGLSMGREAGRERSYGAYREIVQHSGPVDFLAAFEFKPVPGKTLCIQLQATKGDHYRPEVPFPSEFHIDEIMTRIATILAEEFGYLEKTTGPATPAPPAGPSGTMRLTPSFQASVLALRFYEAGTEAISPARRNYQTRFSGSATRHIWWELALQYPAPGTRTGFLLEVICFDSQGQALVRTGLNSHILGDWDSSQHTQRIPALDGGRWIPGKYRLAIYLGGEEVAGAGFEITP